MRQLIVTAATALVDRNHAVTLRAVSREADLPTSSVYQHFPDAPAILLAMCRNAFAELSAVVLAAPDIRAAGLAYLDFAVRHPRRYRVMFGAADLAEPAVRLFEGNTALWLGLHGLAHQWAASRRTAQLAAVTTRLLTSLEVSP